MNIRFHYIAIALVLLTFCQMSAARKSIGSQSSLLGDDARRSGYYFIQACQAKQQGNGDTYYELLKRAAEINPESTSVGFYMGYCRLFLAQGDSAQNAAFALMKQHIDKNPDDLTEARMYAALNMRLNNFEEAVRTYETILRRADNTNDRFVLARARTMNKEIPQAIAEYNKIEQSEGISQQISLQKINLYMSVNDTINALTEARRLYATAPGNIDNNEIMGNVMQHIGMLDSALYYFDRMEEIDPNNSTAALNKASYYYEKGDSVAMDQQIYKALTSEDMPVEQKIEELTRYIRTFYKGNEPTPRVINLFNSILEQHPHDAAIRSLYGQFLADCKQYDQAAEQLSYALDIEPTNIDDWKNIMVVYVMDKKYDKALNAASKAMEYNPNDPGLLLYIPMLYVQIKQPQKAVEMCDTAITRIDASQIKLLSNIWGMKGDAYQAMNDTINTYKAYDEALKLDPDNIGTLNNYAYYLACNGKELSRAESMSARTIKAEPNNPTYLDTYAWVFFKERNFNFARLYIEQALKNIDDDQSADIYEHYGDILFMIGEPEKALEQWQKALELDPTSEMLNRKVTHKTYFYE